MSTSLWSVQQELHETYIKRPIWGCLFMYVCYIHGPYMHVYMRMRTYVHVHKCINKSWRPKPAGSFWSNAGEIARSLATWSCCFCYLHLLGAYSRHRYAILMLLLFHFFPWQLSTNKITQVHKAMPLLGTKSKTHPSQPFSNLYCRDTVIQYLLQNH